MACNLVYGDGPMTVVQLSTYLRHRYDDLQAYFLKERDVLVIPLIPGNEDVIGQIRELAVRKGLSCSQVNAAWPEYLGQEIALLQDFSDFLVITEISVKYLQPG